MSVVAIQDTFLEGFVRLPKSEQRRVSKLIQRLRTDRSSHGLNFERCKNALDPNVYSVRLSRDYRIILVKPKHENVLLLVWVDHHDEAYRWAERKQFVANEKTGTLQMWTVQKVEEKKEADGQEKGLFSHISQRHLLRLGVTKEFLPLIQGIQTEDELRRYREDIPQDTYEYLELLASGESIQEVLAFAEELEREKFSIADAITSSSSSRTIAVITSDEQLREILEQPLDRWRVFLHPQQKAMVEKSFRGPVRILGGAGTGKTVVAMHRARYLVRHLYPDSPDKVLFTTFTTTLAKNIDELLTTMCTEQEKERIEVVGIDALAKRIVEKAYQKRVYIIRNKKLKEFWQMAAEKCGWTMEDLPFLRSEYERVIQQNGIETWEEYLSTPRIGRKKSISRSMRRQVWEAVEAFRKLKQKQGLMEFVDVLREARKWAEAHPEQQLFPYRFAIIDEAQDMHPEGLKLLRALIPQQENDLYIVGDAHQRIYSRQASLGKCGINIKGRRSKRLRINYRTTEEIRQKAVQMIESMEVDNLDGGKDVNNDISLLSGEEPIIRTFKTQQEEQQFVIEQLQHLITQEGIPPHEIAILAPDRMIVNRYFGRLRKERIDVQEFGHEQGKVQCGTMHRSKGLEFRVVFLVEVTQDHVPQAWVLAEKKKDPNELEEYINQQRSLLYVALTLAREKAYITSFGTLSELVS